ncbi:membrane protein [Streptococcus pyogenes JRS4]|uniref:ABC-2 type transporter transmembrane domain-containing protein n=2 Tax=Streptococcus pyogenes TaxID=1314 RepID=Q99XJ6_STRP1|nr:YhgE/Pip domain-containing protein [Streptococcus pyogenes]EQL81414.1 YhgE/Pip C-terminal domain protein [Streptococcus pyogenes GA19681]ERL20787.1 YhgE/Pip C-terminal domain protein [Streptococcus pyogenes GA06023]ESA44508.1 YhgE/Pip C-terminal domain protein [Streptococcus pyogenes GA41039]ESA45869.1 YhgE/Pip C-terminal domain protein [Streptococcus pyogenes GA19700]ESA49079.1 YhgE/Pip C-terminal domain protein [Streptococcus pyogenes GA41208]HER4532396.1 YhgE/Pip domain-containing prote
MLEELKTLIKNPKLMITMIGVALVPALYNLSFLGSMWDPYGRVNDLPIAVVNHDKPAKRADKSLTIGNDMVDKMSKSKDLEYHFVSAKQAQEGLKEGDYYMVITLPEDLSQRAATLLNPEPQKLTIRYQTSKGHGMVAAKMGETAMAKLKESVSQNITKTYTSAVFSSMTDLQSGLKEASAGSQALASGAKTAQAGSQTLSTNLAALTGASQQFQQGTGRLTSGLTTYTDGVNQVKNGLGTLSTDIPNYLNGVSRLSQGASQLNQGLSQLTQATTLSDEKAKGIQSLIVGLPVLNQGIQQLNTELSTLQPPNLNADELGNSLGAIAQAAKQVIAEETAAQNEELSALQATSVYQSLTAEQQGELAAALSQSDKSQTVSAAQTILSSVQTLSTSLQSLSQEDQSKQLEQLKEAVAQIANQSNQALPGASSALTELSTGLAKVNGSLNQQVLPGSNQLTTGLAQLNRYNTAIGSGVIKLSEGANALSSKSGELLDGSHQLSEGATKLADGSSQLSQGGHQLTSGLTELSTGLSTLNGSLAKASQQLSLVSVTDKNAKAVAKPLVLNEKDKDGVKTNGIGMAPYMIAVSLMVVALSTNVIFANSLSGRPVKDKWDWAKQKFVINGFISTMGSIVLYLAIQLLGFEARYGMETLGFIMLSGWTFMALVTALVGWDDRYGSFASLVMLLLQVGSSGGSYPIELSGAFFQKLHPFLPMTYVVSGLRQTISLSGHIGVEVKVLTGFLLAFMVLALLIYRPKKTV